MSADFGASSNIVAEDVATGEGLEVWKGPEETGCLRAFAGAGGADHDYSGGAGEGFHRGVLYRTLKWDCMKRGVE